MSDFAAGMGQGFMNLGNLFFGILKQRMQSGFEDAQAEKRLEAENKARLELQKALDAYNEGRVAGSRPMMGPADQGPPQPMMQDVNASGAAIGTPRAMRPDERYGFDASIEAGRAKAYKDMLDIEKLKSEIDENKSSAEKNRRPSPFRGAAPKSKGKPDLAYKDLAAIHAKLSPDDQKALDAAIKQKMQSIPKEGADPEVVERMWRSLAEEWVLRANAFQTQRELAEDGTFSQAEIQNAITNAGK